ncbi:chitooligosaccharidolytic beta-N-acetylglucosaminidase [Anopheles coustani]|uniref:chitooligosaccharidolytic beta-N-acetylglucosaminidase n=1 Tax=Anopheles coustani TaxID=139045 RepID=UPI00265B403E|nr:chitooligosaccharidolytic beta-N-acetylglucosaminidase [Anopheles coustani]
MNFNGWQYMFHLNEKNHSNAVVSFFNEIQHYFFKNIYQESKHICSQNASLTVKVNVSTDDTKLTWSTYEGYKLSLSMDRLDASVAMIEAETIFGVRHAIETLSQLMVTVRNEIGNKTCSILYLLKEATLRDQPAYAHRGVLIDTARNYIPIKILRKQLEAMASCKMNVLHWHITDTQSFPVVLELVPEASAFGAYSAEAIYTQKDIEDLAQYAKYLGIRIILEFDAPSHAGNGWQWGPSRGLGDLALCINQQPWRSFCIEPPCGQLNPANPNMYNVLQQLYWNFASMNNEEDILHMGGDEVFFGCWNASEEIVNYMRDRGIGQTDNGFLELWNEFQNKSLQLWDNARFQSNPNTKENFIPAPVILWSSQLTEPSVIQRFLDKSRYVIQTWLPSESEIPRALQSLGYKLIISTKDAWYLDHGFWGQTTYYAWKKVYQNQLPEGKGILGGEVCVWTEYIDEHSVEGRIWPRAAAAAERLWSNPASKASDAEPRFFRHRNRLISRGLNPEAVAPKWCEQNEYECQ